MPKITKVENVAILLVAIFGVIGLCALVVGLQVAWFACLAKGVTDYLLPVFDYNYDLTWKQAFAGSAIFTLCFNIIRSATGTGRSRK